MTPDKANRISRLAQDKSDLESLISWHEGKHFIFGDIKIESNHPMHSQLLAVFQNRLKYVETELEGIE